MSKSYNIEPLAYKPSASDNYDEIRYSLSLSSI